MTIFPRKVRQVSPSRDVWICLAAKCYMDLREGDVAANSNPNGHTVNTVTAASVAVILLL